MPPCFCLFPVFRYADTGANSPQVLHGLVVIFRHRSRSHFNTA